MLLSSFTSLEQGCIKQSGLLAFNQYSDHYHLKCNIMRSLLWLPVLLILPGLFSGCNATGGQENADNPSSENRANLESPDIRLQIANIKRSNTAFLIGHYGDQRFRADSSIISPEGDMRFKRDEPYAPGLYVVYVPQELSFQLLIDADQTMVIKGDLATIDTETTVKGNLDTELLQQSNTFEIQIRNELTEQARQMQRSQPGSAEFIAINQKRDSLVEARRIYLEKLFNENPNTLFTSFKKSGQNPIVRDIRRADGTLDTAAQVKQYREAFWGNINLDDPRLLRTPLIKNMLERYFFQLTPKSADDLITSIDDLLGKVVDNPEREEYFKVLANWIGVNYQPGKVTFMDGEAVYVHMVQNYFTRERAFWADTMEIVALQQRASEMAASRIGQPAPNVISTDPNGQTQELLAIKDPYIIVYMYNPECEHCQEQTPKLVDFYRTWKPRGVEVFGIAIDTDNQKWTNYIRQTGMNWINVYDPTNRSIYAKYFVDITPELYVINPERKIIGKNIKVYQIEEIIRRDQASRS